MKCYKITKNDAILSTKPQVEYALSLEKAKEIIKEMITKIKETPYLYSPTEKEFDEFKREIQEEYLNYIEDISDLEITKPIISFKSNSKWTTLVLTITNSGFDDEDEEDKIKYTIPIYVKEIEVRE
ncbi:hypothetical protein N2W52_001939 [Clostridium perfringens]|nr:hypothetical protein [Clostridium perfringens]